MSDWFYYKKRTLLDKILGRNKPVPVFMRDIAPIFHYQIEAGENQGAYTWIPCTQLTESMASKICAERVELEKAGHKAIDYNLSY